MCTRNSKVVTEIFTCSNCSGTGTVVCSACCGSGISMPGKCSPREGAFAANHGFYPGCTSCGGGISKENGVVSPRVGSGSYGCTCVTGTVKTTFYASAECEFVSDGGSTSFCRHCSRIVMT